MPIITGWNFRTTRGEHTLWHRVYWQFTNPYPLSKKGSAIVLNICRFDLNLKYLLRKVDFYSSKISRGKWKHSWTLLTINKNTTSSATVRQISYGIQFSSWTFYRIPHDWAEDPANNSFLGHCNKRHRNISTQKTFSDYSSNFNIPNSANLIARS